MEYHPDWSHHITVGGPPDDCYLAVLCPDHPSAWKNGYVYAHRVVLEQKLGRLLTPNEVAHHKNENKRDNDPTNLEVKTRGTHASEHNKTGRAMVALICETCEVVFQREKRYVRSEHSFCSNTCRAQKMPPPNQAGRTWKWKQQAHVAQ